MEGNDPPNVIIFLDEVEKGFAGNGTDTSGVKTEMMGAYLSWSEDNGVMGILNVGVPGVGKSYLPKTLWNKYGKLFIKFDLAAMQDSLVGNSGMFLRNAFSIVNAVSGGKVLALATCNGMDALPAEMQSRFQLATFFYDAPTSEERESIWKIYRNLYKISNSDPTPTCEGWTGREIKGCCEKAYRLNVSLADAAKYVVPVTVSNAHRIEALRRQSSGKYLSASHEGFYTYDPSNVEIPISNAVSGRKMRG
jgi:SpoVK/Ycf46/Vps4 family AAA+-type ATPase